MCTRKYISKVPHTMPQVPLASLETPDSDRENEREGKPYAIKNDQGKHSRSCFGHLRLNIMTGLHIADYRRSRLVHTDKCKYTPFVSSDPPTTTTPVPTPSHPFVTAMCSSPERTLRDKNYIPFGALNPSTPVELIFTALCDCISFLVIH